MSRGVRNIGFLGDIDRKMALLQEIHRLGQPEAARFSGFSKASLWSMLLIQDVDALERIRDDLKYPKRRVDITLRRLHGNTYGFPKLLSIFVEGNSPGLPIPITVGSQNKAEAEQVKKRDNDKCVVTGIAGTEVCDIFPWVDSRRRGIIDSCFCSMPTYFDEDSQLSDKLALETTHLTDTRRNMICLSPDLRSWWKLGRFILVPIDGPLKMRSRWCQRMKFYWTRATDVGGMEAEMTLDTDPRTRFKAPFDGIDAYNIKDGQVVTVCADCQEDLPDYELLDLQAKLITAWALTGGADPREYEHPSGDEEAWDMHAVCEDLRKRLSSIRYGPPLVEEQPDGLSDASPAPTAT